MTRKVRSVDFPLKTETMGHGDIQSQHSDLMWTPEMQDPPNSFIEI